VKIHPDADRENIETILNLKKIHIFDGKEEYIIRMSSPQSIGTIVMCDKEKCAVTTSRVDEDGFVKISMVRF
jgi:hypothetical protein